uniref:Uncharacterized protein n=1 Tax=Octopus bimaculoides TaxID=37653 RepID=A0A0L8I2W2_OCTBM
MWHCVSTTNSISYFFHFITFTHTRVYLWLCAKTLQCSIHAFLPLGKCVESVQVTKQCYNKYHIGLQVDIMQ